MSGNIHISHQTTEWAKKSNFSEFDCGMVVDVRRAGLNSLEIFMHNSFYGGIEKTTDIQF